MSDLRLLLRPNIILELRLDVILNHVLYLLQINIIFKKMYCNPFECTTLVKLIDVCLYMIK